MLPISFSIIIPNYNGRHLLETNLPSVCAAADHFSGGCEIIVVDDFSSDDSRQWLKQNYSDKVKIVLPDKNLGFSGAIMEGAKAAEGNVVYFLNSDIRVEPDFLDPLPHHFDDPDVFAVGSMAYNGDGSKIASVRAGIVWKWGQPDVDRTVTNPPAGKAAGPTLFASGGHGAYRKNLFLKAGGFHSLYHPFYYEDVDMGYCAWKMGYKIMFEPKSIVYHDHQGTIASVTKKREIEIMLRRNRLLFTWKNITSRKMLLNHIIILPIYIMASPLAGVKGMTTALLRALSKRNDAKLAKAKPPIRPYSKTDEEVFIYLKNEMRSI